MPAARMRAVVSEPRSGHDPGMPSPIYLDNAATTRPTERVARAMQDAQREWFGNPSSKHAFGAGPKKHLADAREFLRGTLGAAEIVFTSGGSEADYLGIVGAASVRSPGRVLMAASDHPAILETAEPLGRMRCHVSVLPVTRDGDIGAETLFNALGADVRVVALMHGHNELGTLSDLEELVALVRRTSPEAHVHVDLVQSYGKIPFDLDAMDIDSVAVSAHKFHGPKGAGFLGLSSKARIGALMRAGGQENGLRGGTENLAGAIGTMIAAEDALLHQRRSKERMESMCQLVEDAVRDEFPDARRLGNPDRRLPHILSLQIPGIVGESLMLRCDVRGVAFSIGSACHGQTAPKRDPKKPDNHVLAAVGMGYQEAREVIRVSFSRETTLEEVEIAATVIVEEAQALLRASPAAGGRR